MGTAGTSTPTSPRGQLSAIASVKAYVDAHLDHRLLYDPVGPQPTNGTIAEHVRAWCEDHLPFPVVERLESVTVDTGRTPPPAVGGVSFAASHRLGGLRAGHRCGRLHGHSYLVAPMVGAALPASLEAFVEANLAGRFLNNTVPFEPTSERLAEHLVRATGPGPGGGDPGFGDGIELGRVPDRRANRLVTRAFAPPGPAVSGPSWSSNARIDSSRRCCTGER